jgi:diamine N-acetyltransferase
MEPEQPMSGDVTGSGGVDARGAPDVSLREVDADNWRDVATLRVPDEQRDFTMGGAYYLSLCHYGDDWHPLAVYYQNKVVGFLMWAIDPADNSGWLGGVLVDAGWQGRGIGRAMLEKALDVLRDEQHCASAAVSYMASNLRAKRLYASMGFVETGEVEGFDQDEPVARRAL